MFAIIGLVIVFEWVDRLFLATPTVQATNWPFVLGITLFVLLGLFLVFARPKIRAYFKKTNWRIQ